MYRPIIWGNVNDLIADGPVVVGGVMTVLLPPLELRFDETHLDAVHEGDDSAFLLSPRTEGPSASVGGFGRSDKNQFLFVRI